MARMTVALPETVSDYIAAQSALTDSPSHPQTLSRIIAERRELHRLELRRIPLTVAEASVIASIMNGTILGPGVGSGILYGELVDAFDIASDGLLATSYAVQYGIDEAELLGKIRGIGPTADLALREAVARWWAAQSAGAHSDISDADSFRAAGLWIVLADSERVDVAVPADFDAPLPDDELDAWDGRTGS